MRQPLETGLRDDIAQGGTLLGPEGTGTLQERVHDWLRRAIFSGRFSPGERLVQADIAERLGVSMTPVREALRDLAADGLLTMNPRRGVTVRQLSLPEVQEIRMLCALLERRSGELTAARITASELQAARRMEQEMAALSDLGRYYVKNQQFHYFLHETTRSPELTRMLRRVHDTTLAYLPGTFLRLADRHREGLNEHRAFLDACAARDPAAAGEIMTRHWDAMFGVVEEMVRAAEDAA